MGTETNKDDRNTPEYLAQLLKDKKQIQALPNVFIHTEKILDEEINRVRLSLFHHQGKRDVLDLPEPLGPVVQLQEKLYVPVKEYPDFNFVGRILGPRGMTAKELEQFTGCKIMVRGKGSMRDKSKEDQNRGKANWEHLNEELHVLITVEDTRNRGEIKLQRAKEEVKKLLVPAPDGEDDLKKRQLMELAIMNGTYRDAKIIHPAQLAQAHLQLGGLPMFLPPAPSLQQGALRGPAAMPHLIPVSGPNSVSDDARLFAQQMTIQMRQPGAPGGAHIIMAPRLPPPQMHVATSQATSMAMNGGAPPPLVSPGPGDHHGLMYNPYGVSALGTVTSAGMPSPMDPYGFGAAGAPSIIEYQTHLDQAQAGAVPKIRRSLDGVRPHPYTRVSLS
ncbi:hypothetical protein EGW08_004671 [Elysia chlorotica]|uniref:K Homology domain-containing protein n=1 Tax=Elysia chlorotica TaxID=188477 RepID=A0A3S0ZV86_ELYCH|nr:hypothetical protein EGW08_004671 [Elysia chlorotica]